MIFSLAFTLFLAGVVTILLPCILPLLPIVLGVSVSGRHRWRPLLTVLGMLVSFVGFTFILQVVLSQFIEIADALRIATYYALLLFGLGFLTHRRIIHYAGAILGGLFFLSWGWIAVTVAALLGVIAMEIGGRVASQVQQLGSDLQGKTRQEFGADSPVTAFLIGLTLGLVWVPCAGPALGFVLTLIREQPGVRALFFLSAYGAGTALPLLVVGYGGQWAVRSVRSLNRVSGIIKQVSGVVLILTSLALYFNWFVSLQTYLIDKTGYGSLGNALEQSIVGDTFDDPSGLTADTPDVSDSSADLPILGPAPELASGGPWHNSPPLTLRSLRGKVVLIDFWTYSCINCIRTLPYVQGYWEKYSQKPFMLIGVHSPEFVFEKSEKNVRAAIANHGLTYPVVQDNDFGTWSAFDNRYWPAKYLIDAEGNIRYVHVGEGDYEETDKAIASLLAEIGVDTSGMPEIRTEEQKAASGRVTRETYVGERSWSSLANAKGEPSDAVIAYQLPSSLAVDAYALGGTWQLIDGEHQTLRSNHGQIVIRALAGEVNLVLGLEDGVASAEAEVWVDGKRTKTFSIDRHDLYVLYKGEYGDHEVVLKVYGKGVEAYAYTFGG